MSTYRLDSIFRPRAVAVVGSQSRPRSVGRAVVENLLASGFSGPIGLVNKHPSPMDGVATVRHLHELPWTPDLVVIATPAATVPQLAAEAAGKGAAAVVVLTAAMGSGPGSPAAQLEALGHLAKLDHAASLQARTTSEAVGIQAPGCASAWSSTRSNIAMRSGAPLTQGRTQ